MFENIAVKPYLNRTRKTLSEICEVKDKVDWENISSPVRTVITAAPLDGD